MTRGLFSKISFDLSGLMMHLNGLPAALGERLGADWKPFRVERHRSGFLNVGVEVEPGGSSGRGRDPWAIEAEYFSGGARYEMKEGLVEVMEGGEARVVLRADEGDRPYYALQNLLRAALAWRMPSRGGAFLHSAGIVLDGNAFLLVGPGGSGKSTWALLGEAAGALVLSDDVVLLDGEGGRPEALGAPFRSSHPTALGPGRWPLKAILFPAHGDDPQLDPVTKMEARGRVLANLPFVAEAFGEDSRIAGVIEGLLEAVPARRLTFSLDQRFTDVIRDL